MGKYLLIALAVMAIIIGGLYVVKINTVPADARKALETEQGAPINRMTQMPDAVRKKMDEAARKAESDLHDAMKGTGK